MIAGRDERKAHVGRERLFYENSSTAAENAFVFRRSTSSFPVTRRSPNDNETASVF